LKKGLIILTSLLFILFSSLVLAVEIDSCQELNSAGTTYYLNQSVNDTSTCFTIAASNIILDCQGYGVNISGESSRGVYSIGRNNLTIQNCNFYNGSSDMGSLIKFNQVDNSFIINNTFSTASYGSYLDLCDGITVSGNVIVTYGQPSAAGIFMYGGANHNI